MRTVLAALLVLLAAVEARAYSPNSVDHMLRRAKAGEPAALFDAAHYYAGGSGAVFQQDDTMVGYCMKQAAEKGLPRAQGGWGIILLSGLHGQTKDVPEAVRWLSLAADKEDPPAMNLLGRMMLNGEGVPKDSKRGRKLLERAALLGNDSADAALQKLAVAPVSQSTWDSFDAVLRRNGEEHSQRRRAAEQLLRNARGGDGMAQYLLAQCYSAGAASRHGVIIGRDFQQAAKWMKLSAENGCTKGQRAWGLVNLSGEGFEAKNLAEAVRWLKPAAAKEDPAALCALGQLYVNGQGVEHDVVNGVRLLERAAVLGSDNATESLKVIQAMVARRDISLFKKLSILFPREHLAESMDSVLPGVGQPFLPTASMMLRAIDNAMGKDLGGFSFERLFKRHPLLWVAVGLFLLCGVGSGSSYREDRRLQPGGKWYIENNMK